MMQPEERLQSEILCALKYIKAQLTWWEQHRFEDNDEKISQSRESREISYLEGQIVAFNYALIELNKLLTSDSVSVK